MARLQKIGISLPSDMVQDIRRVVQSGEYPTMSEVLREALRGWQEKRSHPLARITPRSLADLKRMVEDGAESMKRGGGVPAEQVFAELEARIRAVAKRKKRR